MNRLLMRAPCVCQAYAKGFGTSAVRLVKPDMTKIKKKQAHFQVDDDVPVFLKGGPTDSIIYYACLGMATLGLGMSVNAIWKMSSPK